MSSRETLPDHLLPLPDESTGRWALWRTACVRGAGFPAADVLRIADADCAAAADRLAVVEDETERLRQAALEALRGELEAASKDRLDVLVKAIRRVKRSPPAATEGLGAAPKNDTIGFFGPVGWARLGEGQEVAAARCGPELLAARQVYFEGWAIDAIADRLARPSVRSPPGLLRRHASSP